MIDYIDEWKHVQTTDELLVIVASIDLNPKILEQLMKSTSIVLLDNYFKTYYPHAQKFVFTSIEKSKMLGPISKKEESVEELEKKIKKYALDIKRRKNTQFLKIIHKILLAYDQQELPKMIIRKGDKLYPILKNIHRDMNLKYFTEYFKLNGINFKYQPTFDSYFLAFFE